MKFHIHKASSWTGDAETIEEFVPMVEGCTPLRVHHVRFPEGRRFFISCMEFATLEELMAFQVSSESPLIIKAGEFVEEGSEKPIGEILIYDDYIE